MYPGPTRSVRRSPRNGVANRGRPAHSAGSCADVGDTASTPPPVLAFQSVVDTTVHPSVIYDLFDRLPDKGHALVLFDLNRAAAIDALTKPDAVLPRLLEKQRRYGVTLITNTDASSMEVAAMSVAAGASTIPTEPLHSSWPAEMFSLSHVALPFAEDDPIYGGNGKGRELGSISLGRLTPRGEKNVLLVPMDSLMRVSWNPFFPYVLERIDRATFSRLFFTRTTQVVVLPSRRSCRCHRFVSPSPAVVKRASVMLPFTETPSPNRLVLRQLEIGAGRRRCRWPHFELQRGVDFSSRSPPECRPDSAFMHCRYRSGCCAA